MKIRRAQIKDMERIDELLMQVAMVHHRGRPDLFKYGTRKYTDEQLKAIIGDDERPILAAVDEEDRLLGYAFCIFQQHIARPAHRISAVRGRQAVRQSAWLLQPHAQCVELQRSSDEVLRILRPETAEGRHGDHIIKNEPQESDPVPVKWTH